jgi:hypothetical protein
VTRDDNDDDDDDDDSQDHNMMMTMTPTGRYLLIRAAFKYMEDLRALWAPNQPSRDAQGRLVTETFPRPEAVGKQVIVTCRE